MIERLIVLYIRLSELLFIDYRKIKIIIRSIGREDYEIVILVYIGIKYFYFFNPRRLVNFLVNALINAICTKENTDFFTRLCGNNFIYYRKPECKNQNQGY